MMKQQRQACAWIVALCTTALCTALPCVASAAGADGAVARLRKATTDAERIKASGPIAAKPRDVSVAKWYPKRPGYFSVVKAPHRWIGQRVWWRGLVHQVRELRGGGARLRIDVCPYNRRTGPCPVYVVTSISDTGSLRRGKLVTVLGVLAGGLQLRSIDGQRNIDYVRLIGHGMKWH